MFVEITAKKHKVKKNVEENGGWNQQQLREKWVKSVQSVTGREMGMGGWGQSMKLREINDADLKAVRWTERISTILHKHNCKVSEWLDNEI